MKGKTTMTITIGLICLILTAVIFIQFKTISKIDVTALENMQEADLRSEITTWKTKNEEILAKLEETNQKTDEYNQHITDNKATSELLAQELSQLSGILGTRDVSGSGIVVTLTDTGTKVSATDLLELLNELKMAGAEAISINDERIVYNSYVAEIGSGFISVNKAHRLVAPYVVKAIGNPTYLESGLSKKQYGYIDSKKAKGIDITLSRQDNITINKYDGDLNFEYVKDSVK